MALFNNLENVNVVDFNGKVISERVRNDGKKLLTLYIPSPYNTGKEVFARFLCDNIEIPEYNQRERLHIKGHLNQSIIRKGKRRIYSQYFVADSVEKSPTPTDEAFGIPGKFQGVYNNKIYLTGKIVAITEKSGWLRYTLTQTQNDKEVQFHFSIKTPSRPIKAEINDNVCIVGHVSSAKKPAEDDKSQYYEDLLVDDIAKIE